MPVLLDEIRRERKIELAGDGFRFDDLLPWKAGKLIEDPASILGMKLHPNVKAQYPPAQVSGIPLDANGYIRVMPVLLQGYGMINIICIPCLHRN